MTIFTIKEKIKPSYILVFLIGIVLAVYYFSSNQSIVEPESGQQNSLKELNAPEKVFFEASKRVTISPPTTANSSSASNK